jgi:hypothetical protein
MCMHVVKLLRVGFEVGAAVLHGVGEVVKCIHGLVPGHAFVTDLPYVSSSPCSHQLLRGHHVGL